MGEEFGFNNDILPCDGCIKSDVCKKEKENMMRLHLELKRELDCIVFPNHVNLTLQCKYYYPDQTGCCCK